MVSSKTIVFGFIFLIAVMIIGISASSYGLGVSKDDKLSPEYQASTTFLTISVIGIVFLIVGLVATIILSGEFTPDSLKSRFPVAAQLQPR